MLLRVAEAVQLPNSPTPPHSPSAQGRGNAFRTRCNGQKIA